MEMMNWQRHIPIAPNNKRGRRPHFSTSTKPGMVEKTLTKFVVRPIRKGFSIPLFLKNSVP